MHAVLVNRLGGLSLPRKSVVRLTDRPDMTLDVYCGRKTTMQQVQGIEASHLAYTYICGRPTESSQQYLMLLYILWFTALRKKLSPAALRSVSHLHHVKTNRKH